MGRQIERMLVEGNIIWCHTKEIYKVSTGIENGEIKEIRGQQLAKINNERNMN